MSDPQDQEDDLGGVPSWYMEIFPAGPRDGFFQKLGDHSVAFVDRGAHQLVVTFDNLAEAGGKRYDREPWAAKFCADNGWSHLGIFAQPPSWFRDARLISYLEDLRDRGFFEGFERVAFCGTSMGGFGALTFCDLAPGATVMAFSPQSSLHADLVPWETRFSKGRRQDWSLPYSDATEHTKHASKAFIVFDPLHKSDRDHFYRFRGDNIVGLHGIGLGHKSALVLRRMDRLKPVMKGAIEGSLTPLEFYKLIRARKDVYLYRQIMEEHMRARNREALALKFQTAFKRRRKAKRRAANAEAAQ